MQMNCTAVLKSFSTHRGDWVGSPTLVFSDSLAFKIQKNTNEYKGHSKQQQHQYRIKSLVREAAYNPLGTDAKLK